MSIEVRVKAVDTSTTYGVLVGVLIWNPLTEYDATTEMGGTTVSVSTFPLESRYLWVLL